jgi:redox-sensing transcriptional repressor
MPSNGPVSMSHQAFSRMPQYLHYLKQLQQNGVTIVAAPAVARAMRLHDVQVRKDFAAVSSIHGKPKAGFPVNGLIADMERILGYHDVEQAVLVGVGYLGRALLSYKGFAQYGLNIVMAFDADEALAGQQICGKHILSPSQLSDMCRRMNIHIGIITVPASQAQAVCDSLVESGVLAIWNFAPVHLNTPDGILVQNENMAASLAVLSKHLSEQLELNLKD